MHVYSIRKEYTDWIERYVAAQSRRYVRGLCAQATALMVKEFPELRRTCGFVKAPWGDDQHWWCVAPDGTIVDPTASQFPWVDSYEEVDPEKPHRPIPIGKCMSCGERTYEHSYASSVCSEACEKDLEEYYACSQE